MGRSPFTQACWDGKLEVVQRAVTGSERARLSESDLDTAVCAAIDQGHCKVVSLLLDHGAPMSNEALRRACNRGDTQIIKELLDHGWDPNTQFVNGEPALRGLLHDRDSVKLLLERGADPNLVGQRGVTSLVSALVSCKGPGVADLLISHGAVLKNEFIYKALSPDAKDSEVMTRYLLQRGVDVNTPSRQWGTPLHFAIYRGSSSKVKLLLDAGADPSAIAQGSNCTGVTPAELAKSKGITDMVDMIEEACMKSDK